MNETIKLKQGDTDQPTALTLTDSAGVAIDLTATDAIVFSWKPAGAAAQTITNRAVTPVDLAAGEVSIPWTAGDLDDVGTYLAEIVVTWTGGGDQTFPADGFIEFYIAADLAETAARVAARRRVEIAGATASDPALDSETVAAILDRYRIADADGYAVGHASWTETYDIIGAIAEVWETKAGLAACRTDISAGGGIRVERSTVYDRCIRQARMYRARRTGSATMTAPNGEALDPSLLPLANGPEDVPAAGAGGAGGRTATRAEDW